MSTPEVTAVNGTPPRAVMMSVTALAARDGVSKAAISKKVKRLRDSGLAVELDGQGRVALVNSVQYDELAKRYADPAKVQAPAVVRVLPEATSESYEEARRQLTWVEAERARLKLEAEQKLYVRVEDLEVAATRIGETIVETVDQLLQQSDDLAAAVAREGIHGLRNALKKLATEMKADIADAMSVLISKSTQ
jgi:DNA-binding MurR/RpiR family transcriptional regulator